MNSASLAPPAIETLADLLHRLGDIPLERIRFRPHPGTATEEDVIAAEAQTNRLCELVDGVLVEKAMGCYESRLAVILSHFLESYLEHNDLGIVLGTDGMTRLEAGLVRMPDVAFHCWEQFPNRLLPQGRS